MKKSTKAALISAFIFPGIGHIPQGHKFRTSRQAAQLSYIYLKKFISGVLLFAASAGSISFIVFKTVERALHIIDTMQNSSAAPDIAAIIELVSQQSSNGGNDVLLLNVATAVFVLCWITGIIDSKRVGRVLDKNA